MGQPKPRLNTNLKKLSIAQFQQQHWSPGHQLSSATSVSLACTKCNHWVGEHHLTYNLDTLLLNEMFAFVNSLFNLTKHTEISFTHLGGIEVS